MKAIAILLVGFGFGISLPLWAQTGSPVTAPLPAISAPVQTASVQPKPARRLQRDEQRTARKPAVENTTPATPAPRQNRQNARPRSSPLPAPAVNYAEALKRQHHQRHDRQWWTTRYRIIVFVNNVGYYYWDAGYWFPALGYDPEYENYDSEGPIYTYGNLLPDQVIYNVQRALKELGYYSGPLTGSYSAATRVAISAFQADNGLEATGAIDAPTVEALGLY